MKNLNSTIIKDPICTDKRQQLQNSFLNYCRKDQIPVRLLLANSELKTGKIIGFDEETIILEENASQHLYFKQSLLGVLPVQEVNFIFNEAYRAKASAQMTFHKKIGVNHSTNNLYS